MDNSLFARYVVSPDSPLDNNESDLVMAAEKGSVEAFNQLVLGHQDRIFNLALRILGDEDTAEDITQNTFMNAYLNLSRFRHGSFHGWLYRIATNACYDECRLQKRRPVLSIENKNLAEERIIPLEQLSTACALPEIEVERHEQELVIQSALNRLNPDQRMVIVLVDQQDFDYKEVAQILGIPTGTMKSRLARGRLRLHQILSKTNIDIY